MQQIFYFLEQIALSRAAHACTSCEDLCGWSARRKVVRNSLNVWCFWPTTQYIYVWFEFCFIIFVGSSLIEGRQCRISLVNMSCFISLTKLCSAASITRAPHYSTLNFTYVLMINSHNTARKKLLFFGHLSFNRNNMQTAVTNMTKQRMFFKKLWLMTMPQHTSSEVTVGYNTIFYPTVTSEDVCWGIRNVKSLIKVFFFVKKTSVVLSCL